MLLHHKLRRTCEGIGLLLLAIVLLASWLRI
jgi:hypothetical protein